MPRRVFLCYRHDDTIAEAQAIRAALTKEFSRDFQFVSFESVLGGSFERGVREAIESSDAVIAIIGTDFASATFDDGMSRAAIPTTGVRSAIATALKLDKPVFSVLVAGARLPSPNQLPDDMAALALRNAIVVGDTGNSDSLKHLMNAFEEIGSSILGRPVRRGQASEFKGKPDRIFISYRRSDTGAQAKAIYEGLRKAFGTKHVFMDVDSLVHGLDFPSALDDYLDRSAAVFVLIGPEWLTTADANGRRRIDNPDDFVRLEVATALYKNKAVIPILCSGARMPTEYELPRDLKALPFRHALVFDAMKPILEAVKPHLQPKRWWKLF